MYYYYFELLNKIKGENRHIFIKIIKKLWGVGRIDHFKNSNPVLYSVFKKMTTSKIIKKSGYFSNFSNAVGKDSWVSQTHFSRMAY